MPTRLAAIAVAACALLAACNGNNEPSFEGAAATTAPPTTTTTAAPATTTTIPPPPPPLAGVRAPVVVSPRGVVLPVVGPDPGGVRVGTPCGATTVLANGTPVTASEVVLDAGHGGDEPGAIGPNKLTEKALNSAVVAHAQAVLQEARVSVVLTRTGDYRMTLGARTRIALALRPRAFVSVHHNGDPDGPRDTPGSETYYQSRSADSKRLAGLLYEEIFKAMRQYQVAWVGDTDAGAKYRLNTRGGDYYGIIRQAAGVPTSLVELAFITNGPEAELLARPDVQQAEGRAVAMGILRYLRTSDPGSGFTEPYPRSTPAGPGGGSAGCQDPAL
ncbi:MAG: N-acetylmuramoyl-L-alanine amidase [Actinomycetota bacterium]|jgi:N-acetylmuramoyl-L-alanine amidase